MAQREVRPFDVWAAAGVIIAALSLLSGFLWRSAVASIQIDLQDRWRADIDASIRPVNERILRVENQVDRIAEKHK